MTDQSQNQTQPTPQEDVLTAKLLSQLGFQGTSLIASISYQQTQLAKQGTDLLLTKLPILKNLTPFKSQHYQLDLDLSCVLLDDSGCIIKTIWFGNLGDDDAIYHTGDTLCGAKNFEEHLINQEEIHIRPSAFFDKLPTVTYVLFFISCLDKQPICQAKKGLIKLMDNEDNTLQKINIEKIHQDCHTLLLWQLKKIENEFLLSCPNISLNIQNKEPKHFIDEIHEFSKKHINLEQKINLTQ